MPQIVNDVNMLCGAGVTSIKKAILFVRHGMQHLHETLVGPHRLYPNGKFPDGMTKQERAQLLEDPDTGATWNSIEDFFLHHSCCAWLLAELHRAESEMNDFSNREADLQQPGGPFTDDAEEEAASTRGDAIVAYEFGASGWLEVRDGLLPTDDSVDAFTNIVEVWLEPGDAFLFWGRKLEHFRRRPLPAGEQSLNILLHWGASSDLE